MKTPLKLPRLILKKLRDRANTEVKKFIEKRKIKEAYRQSFNPELTRKYGRPIGWFVFTFLFEKISFPTIIIIFICLRWWEALFITMAAEITIYTIIIAMMHKKQRIRNALKSLCYAPIRYSVLLFDFIVILNFAKDLWITRNRKWRK